MMEVPTSDGVALVAGNRGGITAVGQRPDEVVATVDEFDAANAIGDAEERFGRQQVVVDSHVSQRDVAGKRGVGVGGQQLVVTRSQSLRQLVVVVVVYTDAVTVQNSHNVFF